MTLDGLPFTGQVTTYSVREDNPAKPDYTSETAGTATAWSTGRKTSGRTDLDGAGHGCRPADDPGARPA
jgi:alkaline phosphatase